MLQVLFFLHSIKHPLTKDPIHLSEADKKVIPEIEAIARRFLSSCGRDGRKLLEELPKLMAGEQEWVEMKEQWKEKKKTVMKRTEEFVLEQSKEKEAIKKG